MKGNYKHLFKYFLKREIQSKYLGNLTGLLWVFLQPILTLLIYWYVFGTIFKQRIPEAENIGFIVYLAIGFWPWQALSESIIKSTSSLIENDELIGKINIDFKIPVIATITASFFLTMIGFLIVLLGLILFAEPFNYANIPLLIFPITQFYLLSIAIGLILSAFQIYVRDTLNLVTTFISIWFFLTPIIYSETLLPEKIKFIIKFNPIYIPINFIHTALLSDENLAWFDMTVLTIIFIIFILISIKMFNKLSPYFDEYK